MRRLDFKPSSGAEPSLRPTPGPKVGLGNISASAFLRVFACVCIVWFHTDPHGFVKGIGGIGLAIFLFFSFMYAGDHRDIGTALKRRSRRLLVPWAGWYLVYATIRFWVARGVPPELHSLTSIWTLLDWPAIHLWYLPFVFFASLAFLGFGAIATSIPTWIRIAITLGAGLGMLSIMGGISVEPLPLGIAVRALPAVALGQVYGYCLKTECRKKQMGQFVAIAALVAAACIPNWFWGEQGRMVAIAGTVSSLLMILYTLRLPRYRLILRLGSLTPGIYLAHPFAALVLWKFLGSGLDHWAFALATFVLAASVTWGMRRTRFVRAIV